MKKKTKKIDDIVKTLTPEEIELHNKLIDECKLREDEITISYNMIYENISKYDKYMNEFIIGINTIHECVTVLEEQAIKAKTRFLNNSLNNIPDDEFFNA